MSDPASGVADTAAVAAAQASANDLKIFIGSSRGEMRRLISNLEAGSSLASLQRRALETIRAEKAGQASELTTRARGHVAHLDAAAPFPHSGPVVSQTGGGWALSPALERAFSEAVRTAQRNLHVPPKSLTDRLFRDTDGPRLRALNDSVEVMNGIVALVTRAIENLDADVESTSLTAGNDARAARERAEARLTEMLHQHAEMQAHLPAPLLPWSNEAWMDWHPSFAPPELFAGHLRPRRDPALGDNADFGSDVVLPFYVRPSTGLHLVTHKGNRQAAQALVRALLLRSLTAHAPGALQLTVFDPVGLGQSVAPLLALADYDPELLGGKIWSGAADFKAKMAEQLAHVELVVQKYLRSDYSTLAEFNAAAGEIATPYRLLVVFDFPTHFDQESFGDLRRLIETGPRCGVGTILVTNGDDALPHGIEIGALRGSMTRVNMAAPFSAPGVVGYELLCDFAPDADAEVPAGLRDRIIEEVGANARVGAERTVGFRKVFSLFNDAALRGVKTGLPSMTSAVDPDDPSTWWTVSTATGVGAPIGQAGARDVAALMFDSSDHSGALLVGRPGSGKSTLLHAFIAGVTRLYSPEELELHLIDFKEGVEFKAYAAAGLPHARSVAIESDREFGLSVLQAIQAELTWRADILRGSEGAHASLEALRAKSGDRIPRIVLLFDEFQVLFARNDKIGAEAAALLESLIRQGRGFGIHVFLASQSLSGLDALGSHVPQLLPVRVLLPSSDVDAARVLGEGNTAGGLLLHAGDGVLNAAGGAVEANQPFRGSLISEEERNALLTRLRERADDIGFVRRPVVFEGNNPIPAEETSPDRFIDEIRGAPSRTLRLRFAAPMAISGTADIDLRREAGANLLFVARDGGTGTPLGDLRSFGLPHAVATNVASSAVAAGARVEVVDFLPIEDGLEDLVGAYLASSHVALKRRRQLPDLLTSLSIMVDERVEADDVGAEATLLMLFGMHRARDFDTESVDFDTERDLPGLLARIVRNGPEVGVHTFMWCETLPALSRRVGSAVTRECSWRLAGRMSADDSHSLIGVDTAVGLREQQVIVANEDLGRIQRCTSLSRPPAPWVDEFLAVLDKR